MLNLKTDKFSNYTEANGLPSEQFNYNSSCKSADGTLFFGTVAGMISFKPESFIKNTYIPAVYITGIRANGKELSIADKEASITQSPIYTDKIKLPYDRSNLSFDVALLSYVIPKMNSFQYQMQGLDNQWYSLSSQRKISFPNSNLVIMC
jgi:hypothetical protein